MAQAWITSAGCIVVVGLCGLSTSIAGAASNDQVCHRPSGSTATGTHVTPEVALASPAPADPMNMGSLRGVGETDITVSASPALPKTVTPRDITLAVPKRFERSGTGLSTAYLAEPTFSRPRILAQGKLIAFTLCEDASDINAGSYVGQVIVGGPPGVQSATVAITLNAKNESFFRWGIGLAALLAFGLLFLRGFKVNFDTRKSDDTLQAAEKTPTKAAAVTVKDYLGFWAPTLIGVGGAIAAMLSVYDADVSWGADTVSSGLALGGTAISAAGLGTFLSSLKGS